MNPATDPIAAIVLVIIVSGMLIFGYVYAERVVNGIRRRSNDKRGDDQQ